MMDKTKTIAVNIVLIAVLAVVMFWGNTWYRQWHQFGKAEKALAGNDLIAAIAGYESAIHMYTPGSPLVNRAAERLWEITRRAEASGNPEGALIACRALRSSFYAVRGLHQPGKEWITRCDAKIEELVRFRAQMKH